MKRKFLLLATLVTIASILTMVFCACSHVEQQGAAQLLQQQYNNISSATTIVQKITITKGMLTQFDSDKTYVKTADGYTITGTEKKFNGVDKLFDETTINQEAQNAVGAKPTLKLDESYFQSGYRLSEIGLTAYVKDDNIKDVFGITDGLEAPTDNLMLELSVTGGHLSMVRITYESYDSHVVITLEMSY